MLHTTRSFVHRVQTRQQRTVPIAVLFIAEWTDSRQLSVISVGPPAPLLCLAGLLVISLCVSLVYFNINPYVATSITVTGFSVSQKILRFIVNHF